MSIVLRRICGCCYKPSVSDENELTTGRQESLAQEQVYPVAWKSASTSPVDMTGVATCDSVVKKPDNIEQPGLRNIAWVSASEGTQTVEGEGAAATSASGWDPTQTQIQAEKDKERLPLPWEEVYAKGFVPFDGTTIGPSWRETSAQNITVDKSESGSDQVQRVVDVGSSGQGQKPDGTGSDSEMSSKVKTKMAKGGSSSANPTATAEGYEVQTDDVKETQTEQATGKATEQTPQQTQEQFEDQSKTQAAGIKLVTE